jgi:TPR repeat protein
LALQHKDALAARVIGLLYFTGNQNLNDSNNANASESQSSSSANAFATATSTAPAPDRVDPTETVVQVDIVESMKWLRLASDLGDLDASKTLAQLLDDAMDVYTKAISKANNAKSGSKSKSTLDVNNKPNNANANANAISEMEVSTKVDSISQVHAQFQSVSVSKLDDYPKAVLAYFIQRKEDPVDMCMHYFERCTELGCADSLLTYGAFAEKYAQVAPRVRAFLTKLAMAPNKLKPSKHQEPLQPASTSSATTSASPLSSSSQSPEGSEFISAPKTSLSARTVGRNVSKGLVHSNEEEYYHFTVIQGHACSLLSAMWFSGIGGAKNHIESKKWLDLANELLTKIGLNEIAEFDEREENADSQSAGDGVGNAAVHRASNK